MSAGMQEFEILLDDDDVLRLRGEALGGDRLIGAPVEIVTSGEVGA